MLIQKSMGSLFIKSLLLCLAVAQCRSQDCGTLSSCYECIGTFSCAWCSTPGSAQCFSRQDTNKLSSCTAVVDPQSSITVTELPLSESHQVSVESVQMKLRVGETQNFTVSVKSADNFPLDLYILMDFSGTFQDDLESARSATEEIVAALQNVTSQFRVGFGKFTDKSTPPYTSFSSLNLVYTVNGQMSSCKPSFQQTSPCARPIPYEHVVTLTNSSMEFSSAIQALVIEVSTDDPEGVLDAMMQAVVCTDIVGWREEARKVLLVMTDDVAHTAGDGRLAAIHTPNDGQCHTQYDPQLNKIVYVDSLDYDYPSIEQLKTVLLENGVVPVFAISTVGPTGLSSLYEQIGFVANLASDSDNLVGVISQAYSQVVSHVGLSYAKPSFLDVSIVPDCPQGSSANGSDSCNDVAGQLAQFQVYITLTNCSEILAGGGESTFNMYVPGFGYFQVLIEGQCSCDCDQPANIDKSSSVCSSNGDLVCGQCQCMDTWQGDTCDCQSVPCPFGPNGLECGGNARGSCDNCGACTCNGVSPGSYPGVDSPAIYGQACECDNFLCDPGANGLICSGRGKCMCSQGIHVCECGKSPITGDHYTGEACECSTDSCINPADTSTGVCGGHGDCRPCNPQGSACICLTSFYGGFCESFISGTPSCTEADSVCVMCYSEALDQGDDASSLCSDQCLNYTMTEERKDDGYQIPGTVDGFTTSCAINELQCSYMYYVGTAISGETVVVIEPKTCLPIPWYIIPLIAIIGLAVIALLIIIAVKLIYAYMDSREVKRLEWDVRHGEFKEENPMYQGPIAKYTNPQYEVGKKNS